MFRSHSRRIPATLLTGAVGALLLGAVACASSTENKSTGTGTFGSEKKLSDAEIAAVVTSANLGEIEVAQLAKTLATSEEVKSFADLIIRDHTAANDKNLDLFRRLTIAPIDSDLSRELNDSTKKTIESLRDEKGEEFDHAYVEAGVKNEERVLEIIDKDLIPNVSSAELSANIRELRAAVESHLTEAKRIRDRPVASN